MKRSTLICLLFLAYCTFGYRLGVTSDGISKIYLAGNTLIRTTPGTGIRFYDLSRPASPQTLGSIAITQNSDVAVKGHYMYADNGLDLLVYDIADLAHPVMVDSIHYAFQSVGLSYMIGETMVGERSTGSSGCHACSQETPVAAPSTGPMVSGGAGSTNQAGSMARFAVVGDYLYCIDSYSLRVFEIMDPARPRYKNQIEIGWQIETLFPYQDKLFIGGSDGMYIYSLAHADSPVQLSEFHHARRCDPVVADGKYAYVTLRSTGACGGNDNQLDILDVSDVANPQLLNVVPMTGPYGLATRSGLVFVCDGSSGVTIVDATNPQKPAKVGGLAGITAHDIILGDNVMIVTAESGFFLYDLSDLRNPRPCGTLRF
ncbi:MAG TPA: hypothetical protein VHI13_11970 [Candidatus Kapabacteria bacterium]|nr:hypothetical protein [Candidatus Kapabacteria bacterium]